MNEQARREIMPFSKASKNDITGDTIKTRNDEQTKYADGWERIFSKPAETTKEEGNEDEKETQEPV